MIMDIKLPYDPSDLSYYTTWWLTPEPSTSSQNTTSLGLDEGVSVDKYQKKQKMIKTSLKSTCCIPIKIFRLK